jgi:LuxR family glucitol operon transcriptional activator
MSRQGAQNPRLGEQIKRLIRSLAATKSWSMTGAMAYISEQTSYSPDTVYRWRQGKNSPNSQTLEILVQIGKNEANLSREWGESLLQAGNYIDTTNLVNRLWGLKYQRSIPCNLPPPDHSHLIGRQKEIDHLLELLSPERGTSLITVDGIGGVGKTALILEVAYRCLRASTGEELNPKMPLFDTIIFVSAKQHYLKPDGLLPSKEAKRTLRDIHREIASTLDHFEIMSAEPDEQSSRVHKILSRQQTLLIVDNLETMEDRQEIMSFLYYLPRSVKVIITSRERGHDSPIHLEQLSLEEALTLIEKESQEKEAEVSSEQAYKLYKYIGGIPAALIYSIGQIASGFSVETVLEKIPRGNSDVARFCFEGSLATLREQLAHYLLMAIAMFSKPPKLEALAYTVGLQTDKIAVEEGLAQLQRLSLVRKQGVRYIMLPLTREYALSELAAHPAFEQEARTRWVKWYLKFTDENGGKDWQEWHSKYDLIDEEWENLLTVFDWCASNAEFDKIQEFWQEYELVKFTHIYGYWEDRRQWLEWLIQEAEMRGDWSVAAKARVDIGTTLTLFGQFEEANQHFLSALKKRKYIDRVRQLLLIQKIVDLRIRQQRYSEASGLLDEAEELLDKIVKDGNDPRLSDQEKIRRRVDFKTHKALLFYSQKNFEQAKPCYKEILDLAKTNDITRTAKFAQHHLAFIEIEQDHLDEAEDFLETSLPVEKDKRLVAFHKHVFAYFYRKKGIMNEALRLAREARDEYNSLGMIQETMEMDELLRQLLS